VSGSKPDPRNFLRAWISFRSQRYYPVPGLQAEHFKLDPGVRRRKRSQASQSRLQQGARTSQVASSIMVKRRSNLNDSLKKRLFGFRGLQPDLLPGFVGIKELAGVELLQSAAKLVAVRTRLGCFGNHTAMLTGRSPKNGDRGAGNRYFYPKPATVLPARNKSCGMLNCSTERPIAQVSSGPRNSRSPAGWEF
jgi:hypothetical protein